MAVDDFKPRRWATCPPRALKAVREAYSAAPSEQNAAGLY